MNPEDYTSAADMADDPNINMAALMATEPEFLLWMANIITSEDADDEMKLVALGVAILARSKYVG